MNKIIIGLAGKKQSGKTSAARQLEKSGFVRYSFAAPIRAMMTTLLKEMGRSDEEIDMLLNVDKTARIPGLEVTARDCLQTLGTEWGRCLIDPYIWINPASHKIKSSKDNYIVFDDVRFENEATFIRDLGGYIIHINRGDMVKDGHASEQGIKHHDDDYVIDNDSTLNAFMLELQILVAGFSIII